MPCAAVIVGQCAPLHMLEWSFFFFIFSKKLSEDLLFQFFLKSLDNDMFLLYTVVTINDNNRTLCCPIQSLIIFLIKQIRLPLCGHPVLFFAAT